MSKKDGFLYIDIRRECIRARGLREKCGFLRYSRFCSWKGELVCSEMRESKIAVGNRGKERLLRG